MKTEIKIENQTPSLLLEAARKKAASLDSNKSPLGKELSNKFSKRGGSLFAPRKRGGRNGQGKP